MKKIFLILLTVSLLSFGCNKTKKTDTATQVTSNIKVVSSPFSSNTPNENKDTNRDDTGILYKSKAPDNPESSFGSECSHLMQPLASKSGLIEWVKPQFQKKLLLFNAGDGQYVGGEESFLVGHFIKGKYKNGDLLLTIIPYPSMGTGETLNHVARLHDKYYFLSRYSEGEIKTGGDLTPSVNMVNDTDFVLPDLDFPKNFHISNPPIDFSLYSDIGFNTIDRAIYQFCDAGLTKIFENTEVGDVYTNSSSTIFYVRSPDNTERVYQPKYDIMDNKNVPMITWSDGTKNVNEYSYQRLGGFGPTVLRDVQEINAQDIIQTGTTINGEPVYEYKDPNGAGFKEIYQSILDPFAASSTNPSYSSFVSEHPVFFWKDPFGKFIRFIKTKYHIYMGWYG